MNRRIIISEDERSRILNLHETRKQKEWGLLFEQMAGAGEPTDLNLTDNKKPETGQVVGGGSQPNPTAKPGTAVGVGTQPVTPPKTKDEVIAFQEWVVKNKKENIGTKDVLGKGPGVDGIFGAKSQAAWTKHSAEYNKSKEIQTSGNDALTYTYYIKDASGNETTKVFTTVDELNKAIAAKQVTPETRVWKKELGQTPKTVKEINSVAINDAIASIAPEAVKAQQPGTTFKISPDGKQPAKDYTQEQLTTAIKDGSLTQNAFVVVTDQATGKSSYQSIMQNPDTAKIVNLASGPEQVADQFKTTKIPELDAWLKGPIGSVWDKMEEGKLKENSLDTYTKRDPQLKAIADKIGIGKLRDALGTQRSTAVGRGLANLRNKVVTGLGGTVQKNR